MERPPSITVIAFILIGWAAIALLGAVLLLGNPEAVAIMEERPAAILLLFTGPLIMLVSGMAILRGRNWGRILFIVWGILNFGVALLLPPFAWADLVPVALFLVIAYFLFRPEANAYFSPEIGAGEPPAV